jgi:CRP-like cAMP-binding protein
MDIVLEKILFLEKVDIFKSLSLEELSQLAAITASDNYTEDEILFRQGDPGDFAYIVVSGEVELYIEDKIKGHQVIQVAGSGACFGEMALMDGLSRSASARIKSESVIAKISREDFLDVLKSFPSIGLALLRELTSRLRVSNDKIKRFTAFIREAVGFYRQASVYLEEEEKP